MIERPVLQEKAGSVPTWSREASRSTNLSCLVEDRLLDPAGMQRFPFTQKSAYFCIQNNIHYIYFIFITSFWKRFVTALLRETLAATFGRHNFFLVIVFP